MTVGITSVVSLVALVFPKPILSTFMSDPEVLKEGIGYLRIVAFAYIPYSSCSCCPGYFEGLETPSRQCSSRSSRCGA